MGSGSITASASAIGTAKSSSWSVVCWYPTKPSAKGAGSWGKRLPTNSDVGARGLAAVFANLPPGFEHLILQNARRVYLAGLQEPSRSWKPPVGRHLPHDTQQLKRKQRQLRHGKIAILLSALSIDCDDAPLPWWAFRCPKKGLPKDNSTLDFA